MKEITVKLPYEKLKPGASATELADLFRAFADDAAHFLAEIADDLEGENPAVSVEEIQFALDYDVPFIAREPTSPAK
jgi:hypothetical protein